MKQIGKYTTLAVPVAGVKDKVGEAQRQILSQAMKYQTMNYVYVINKKEKLVGVMSIKELVATEKEKPIAEVMVKNLVTVRARTYRERAVYLALQHSLKALPVVDKRGKFLGVVPSDALLQILYEEANQDLFYLAGSKSVTKEPVISQVKVRLPWILVGLLGGVVSSSVIAGFEVTLLELVRLAAFIPVILNISGNVATQSAVLFVREVSLGKITGMVKALGHEVATGAVIGVVSGLLLGGVAWVGHGSYLLGVIVGVAILITQTTAAVLGLLVPWGFKALGKDPALGTGPVVTTIMDIAATTVYLTVAWVMLGWV